MAIFYVVSPALSSAHRIQSDHAHRYFQNISPTLIRRFTYRANSFHRNYITVGNHDGLSNVSPLSPCHSIVHSKVNRSLLVPWTNQESTDASSRSMKYLMLGLNDPCLRNAPTLRQHTKKQYRLISSTSTVLLQRSMERPTS